MSQERGTDRVHQLVDHFFRRESGRLVALLSRVFGLNNFDLAEDVVQHALVRSLETWKIRGVPADPAGWLYQVARNRALDLLRQRDTAARLGPEVTAYWNDPAALGECFLEEEIEDSQLRMIFACCHPQLPPASRIALTLKTLCGVGSGEIARALLTSEAAVKKRIARAKALFRSQPISLEVPTGAGLEHRLESVHLVVYLLFNEGYNSAAASAVIRRDLCEEALRLGQLLAQHRSAASPATHALMALMLFHAARLDTRLDDNGDILLLEDQDRSRWDRGLISRAFEFHRRSTGGPAVSRYHLEAGIAAYHCLAPSFAQTDWKAILRLYDMLLELQDSPLFRLNRAIVLAQLEGPQAGLASLKALVGRPPLKEYYLLDATLGQLYLQAGDKTRARTCFLAARGKTSAPREHRLLERKLAACRPEALQGG